MTLRFGCRHDVGYRELASRDVSFHAAARESHAPLRSPRSPATRSTQKLLRTGLVLDRIQQEQKRDESSRAARKEGVVRSAMAQLRAPADEERLQQEAPHGVAGGGDVSSNKKARAGLCGVLRERKVVELARAKRRLVEVPYTATLAHTANALLAARVSGVAVAAPPGHWIGAGGSMILESDPATGAVRKHYIGMVNMLDILAHIAEASDDAEADGESFDLDRRMAVPVSSVIGHSLEGLTLWTLHPTTRYAAPISSSLSFFPPLRIVCNERHDMFVPPACWTAWRRSARGCTARWCRWRARRTTWWRWSWWSRRRGTGCSPRWTWRGSSGRTARS